MQRTRTTIALIFTALVAACVGPAREEVLDPMVGQDVDLAIEAFGQPAETIDLEDGKHAYIWRRVYKYDKGRRAGTWPERRLSGWHEDPDQPEDARVCSTQLIVGFDFLIEGWSYGCETVIAERTGRPMPRYSPIRMRQKPAH